MVREAGGLARRATVKELRAPGNTGLKQADVVASNSANASRTMLFDVVVIHPSISSFKSSYDRAGTAAANMDPNRFWKLRWGWQRRRGQQGGRWRIICTRMADKGQLPERASAGKRKGGGSDTGSGSGGEDGEGEPEPGRQRRRVGPSQRRGDGEASSPDNGEAEGNGRRGDEHGQPSVLYSSKEKAAVAALAVEAAARMAKAEGSAGGTMATMTAASRGDDGDGEDGQQKDGGDGEGSQRANDGDGEGGQPGGRWDQHMTTTETTTTAATTATTTTTTMMKTDEDDEDDEDRQPRREEIKAETSTDSVPSPCKADLLHRGG